MTAHAGLQIDEDRAFQRREWRFQRVGWAAMAAFIALALAGALGSSGPLAHATRTAPDQALAVEYLRLMHVSRTEHLRVTIPPEAGAGDAELVVGWDFVRHLPLETVTPTPISVAAEAAGLRYRFARAEHGAPLLVAFAVRPARAGVFTASLGRDAPRVTLRVAVLP